MAYKDFPIPDWETVKARCIYLSEQFPEAAIVGWDFAYNDQNEWVIIEANCMPEFVFQGPTGVGVREEFDELIARRKAIKWGNTTL